MFVQDPKVRWQVTLLLRMKPRVTCTLIVTARSAAAAAALALENDYRSLPWQLDDGQFVRDGGDHALGFEVIEVAAAPAEVIAPPADDPISATFERLKRQHAQLFADAMRALQDGVRRTQHQVGEGS